MAGGGGGEDLKLEYTPSWVVAVVCSVIIIISIIVERLLHYLGEFLEKRHKKPLFEALQKVKEELMLMGFISLLLAVFQEDIQKTCIPSSWNHHLLPCKNATSSPSSHFQSTLFPGVLGGARRLLAGGGGSDHCAKKGKVPLLSLGALHDLHIFIFVLATTHVVLSALTMVVTGATLRRWKGWEDSLQAGKEGNEKTDVTAPKITYLSDDKFIRKRFGGLGKDSTFLGWLHSFVVQFYPAIDRDDYEAMRLAFIMTHCKTNPKFNFYKYMVRSLEADFKQVVGISWYLWFFVIIFLFSNIDGSRIYFWIAIIPLLLLLLVGTKLEHVITQMAHEVAEKHTAVEGDPVINPSDDHFWLNKPRLVLYLIHFILFQNAFEIAFFLFVWMRYGFHSCIMGRTDFAITRVVIGVIVQGLCSYSTLPLYAIVTQMGSAFNKAIFDEHLQKGLVGWAQKTRKKRKGMKEANNQNSSRHVESVEGSSMGIQMQNMGEQREALMEEGNTGLVGEANRTKEIAPDP